MCGINSILLEMLFCSTCKQPQAVPLGRLTCSKASGDGSQAGANRQDCCNRVTVVLGYSV
jgi:hypothetical protein